MKVLSAIKSHKIITTSVALVAIFGIGGAVYASTRPSDVVKQPAAAQVSQVSDTVIPEKPEETKPIEKTKETVIKKEDSTPASNSQKDTEEAKPEYSEAIPQIVLSKAVEMQNARKSMNERYMSDIFWLYEERPELLQEGTYTSTLAKMKTIYTSEKEPKSAMFFTLQLKEAF